MNHWIMLPILIPVVFSMLILTLVRHDIFLTRVFSMSATVLTFATGLFLLSLSWGGEITSYHVGNWAAPFGINLVLDRLSAMMLVLTSTLSFFVLLYSLGSWDRRGPHFHTLFQLQVMGINGAFLTGDLFNLFVFFEVLLIASYGLMVHGGGPSRMRAGIQYVAINLIGSALFLIGVGLIYSVTGTLNMADLSLKVAATPSGDQAILQTGAILLLLVFAIKAALVPIHTWLPGTYSEAPGPVAALFAIMTKVGVYSTVRVYFLIFGSTAGAAAGLADQWLLGAAVLTLIVGALGVLAAKSLGVLVSFAVIGSIGTLVIPISMAHPEALSAALFYLIHSTFAAAALFLIVDRLIQSRGTLRDRLKPSPEFFAKGTLAALFFVAAIAMTGMPPLSGFLGKLMVLKSSLHVHWGGWVWALILVTSLFTLIGFSKAGSLLFWKPSSETGSSNAKIESNHSAGLVAIAGLLLVLILQSVFAGPVHTFSSNISAQIFSPHLYIEAVLSEKEGQK